MKNILVVGSLNIDSTTYVDCFPNDGETISALSIKRDFGGKGFNQAIAIKRANDNVNFIGSVGDDEYGNSIISNLKDNNIKDYILINKNSSSGIANIMVNSKSTNRIAVISGANSLLNNSFIDENEALFKNSDALFVQYEIPISTIEHSLLLANKYKLITLVNPAPFKELKEDYYPYIDFLVPNEEEFNKIVGVNCINNEERILESHKLISKGIKNIVITLGSEGALFISKDLTFNIPAIKVDAIDTVAAGDTFCGVFLSSYLNLKDIKKALIRANKASSITVQRKGSSNSIPYFEEYK